MSTKVSSFEDMQLKPLEVKVTGNFESAFRWFKTLVQNEGIVAKYKEKMSYEKPSVRKRRKEREAQARALMLEAREQMIVSGEWEKRQKRKEQKKVEKAEKRRQQQEQSK